MSRRSARTSTVALLESLEDRIALSTSTVPNAWEALVNAKGDSSLGAIYSEFFNYVQSGSKSPFVSPFAFGVEMIGPTVGVEFKFAPGSNFATNAAEMQDGGVVLTAGFPSLNIIEGFVPIGQLPGFALDPSLGGMSTIFKPSTGTPIPAASTGSSAASSVAPIAGPVLGSIYQEFVNYEQAGGTGTFSPVEASQVQIQGDAVRIDITAASGDYDAVLAAMEMDGLDVTATAPQVGVIEGFLPIAQLPLVSYNADLTALSPVYRPIAR